MKKGLLLSLKIYFLKGTANPLDLVRPGPTVTLFDALYLRTYCRYGFQILTQCLHTV